MTRLRLAALALLSTTAVGCGSSDPAPPPTTTTPLTVEQWKALPPDTKFEIATLERLREGTPKLMDQREWDKFTRDVILPAKKAAKK